MADGSIEKGLHDAILAVFGGAAGGIAYASLTEPAATRIAVSLVLIGMVWLVSWQMHEHILD